MQIFLIEEIITVRWKSSFLAFNFGRFNNHEIRIYANFDLKITPRLKYSTLKVGLFCFLLMKEVHTFSPGGLLKSK